MNEHPSEAGGKTATMSGVRRYEWQGGVIAKSLSGRVMNYDARSVRHPFGGEGIAETIKVSGGGRIIRA